MGAVQENLREARKKVPGHKRELKEFLNSVREEIPPVDEDLDKLEENVAVDVEVVVPVKQTIQS